MVARGRSAAGQESALAVRRGLIGHAGPDASTSSGAVVGISMGQAFGQSSHPGYWY
jgi:hypothetical protein